VYDLRDTENQYEGNIIKANYMRAQILAAVCSNADCIILTATDAVINRRLLEFLGANISNLIKKIKIFFFKVIIMLYISSHLVMVEGASRLPESQLICSFTRELKQVIMMGKLK